MTGTLLGTPTYQRAVYRFNFIEELFMLVLFLGVGGGKVTELFSGWLLAPIIGFILGGLAGAVVLSLGRPKVRS